jgi:PGF-pre-PGF domain-containing protein
MMKKLFLGILLMLCAQALFASPSLAATAVVDVSQLLGWGVPEFSAGDVTYPAAVPFMLLFENNGTTGLNVSGNLSIIKDGSIVYTADVFQGNVSGYQNRSFAFSWTPSLSGDFLANLTINITSSYDGQSNLTSMLTSFTVYSPPSAAPSGPSGMYTTLSNATSSAVWDRLLPGVPVWLEIKNALIAFSRVALVAGNETRYVRIEIYRIYELPRTVSEPPGKIYQYLEIRHENLAGNLKNATIDFGVEKKWMLDNGIDVTRVFLMRYSTDGRWENLAAALLKEDSLYAYYRSELSSLSIFSIIGMQKAACQTGDRRCNDSYLQACSPGGVWESVTQCENGCDKNEKACVKTKPACSGEEKRCAGDVLQKCSADGFGWDIVERCKYGCWDNECKEMYVSFITRLAVSVMLLILVAIVAIMAYLVYINLKTFLRKK